MQQRSTEQRSTVDLRGLKNVLILVTSSSLQILVTTFEDTVWSCTSLMSDWTFGNTSSVNASSTLGTISINVLWKHHPSIGHRKGSKALYKKARWTKETMLRPKVEISKLTQPRIKAPSHRLIVVLQNCIWCRWFNAWWLLQVVPMHCNTWSCLQAVLQTQ